MDQTGLQDERDALHGWRPGAVHDRPGTNVNVSCLQTEHIGASRTTSGQSEFKSRMLCQGPRWLVGPPGLRSAHLCFFFLPTVDIIMPASSLPPPTKRRKTKQNADIVKELEAEITTAVTNNTSLNSLLDLLNLSQEISLAADLSKIIYSLYRIFIVIISSEKLSPGGSDAAKQVRKWIWERLDTFVELLVGLLQDEEPMLRVCFGFSCTPLLHSRMVRNLRLTYSSLCSGIFRRLSRPPVPTNNPVFITCISST